jgi:hypothetical protein
MSDCILKALIELGAHARLTDLLNAGATVTLYDVHVYALDDGRELKADQVEVDVAELHVVEALDKAQMRSRHVHTRTAAVEVHSGPYRIVGRIHAPLGGDPVQAVMRRPEMIPLTEALLEFEFAGGPARVESEVVIFNRAVARRVRSVD